MATPVRPNVGEVFKAVRNAMVDLFLILVCLIIRLADTFCDNFGIALCMTSIFAVCTLHAGRVFEEVPTKRASHDIVKLLLDELVALFLVNFFLFLSNGSLSIQTDIEWSPSNCLFLKAHR